MTVKFTHRLKIWVTERRAVGPGDTEENRQRFRTLHRVFQSAFLARPETPENERARPGHLYRERDAVLD